MFTRILCLALLASGTVRSVADIQRGIAAIGGDVQTLGSRVDAFDGSLSGALAIHTDAQALNAAIAQATADTQWVAGPVTEDEGRDLLLAFAALAPGIENLSAALVAKKPLFRNASGVDATPIVKADIVQQDNSTQSFSDALFEILPGDLRVYGSDVAATVNAALAKALGAYS